MSIEAKKWNTRTWLWSSIAAAIVAPCLSAGIGRWLSRNGRGLEGVPGVSESRNPKLSDQQSEQPSNETSVALQMKALAIAKDAVKTREKWYDEAEYLPPYREPDDSWVVWVVRPEPKGDRHFGRIVYIEIDRNGRIALYQHKSIGVSRTGDFLKENEQGLKGLLNLPKNGGGGTNNN